MDPAPPSRHSITRVAVVISSLLGGGIGISWEVWILLDAAAAFHGSILGAERFEWPWLAGHEMLPVLTLVGGLLAGAWPRRSLGLAVLSAATAGYTYYAASGAVILFGPLEGAFSVSRIAGFLVSAPFAVIATGAAAIARRSRAASTGDRPTA